jgi:hypothetical protein
VDSKIGRRGKVYYIGLWPVELCILGFFKEGLLTKKGASPKEWPALSLGFCGKTTRRRRSKSKGTVPASSLGIFIIELL